MFISPTSPAYSIPMPVIELSVSWPANRPSCSASAMNGLRRGASSAEIDGMFRALVTAPLIKIIRHLFGHLDGDVFLCLAGRGAEMGRADDVVVAEQADGPLPVRFRIRPGQRLRHGRRRVLPSGPLQQSSPPRAQLMMRTPCLVFDKAVASIMLRVLSVNGVCREMKSARLSQECHRVRPFPRRFQWRVPERDTDREAITFMRRPRARDRRRWRRCCRNRSVRASC